MQPRDGELEFVVGKKSGEIAGERERERIAVDMGKKVGLAEIIEGESITNAVGMYRLATCTVDNYEAKKDNSRLDLVCMHVAYIEG